MKRNAMKTAIVASAILLGGAMAAMAAGTSDKDDAKAEDSNYPAAVKAVKAQDYAGALTLLAKVVDKDPKNADAWNYMGFADRKLGKFPELLAAYEKALAI